MAVIETQGFKLDNSGKRIVVDPVTRIEGHLRIEVNVDDKNVIRNAVSTGTMWRGLEVILKGRDPRDAWAFVERICGVCTGVHALASVRAVEDALGIKIPDNANIIRNLMHADAVRAGPPGALLPPARARLGRRGLGARRPTRRRPRSWRRSISPLADVVAGLLPRPAEPAEEVRRIGPARPVPQRLLGPPGLQAAARGQPDGRGALPRGARLPEGDRQDPDHLRRQEPAPELAGRRRAVLDQPRRHRGGRRDQHGAPEHGVEDHRRHHRVHRQRLHPRPARDRLLLQGLGRHRRRALEPERDVLRRLPRHRQRLLAPRACSCRAARSSTAISRRSSRST